MSDHTYRYYARPNVGDLIPSVWCGDIAGPNVYRVRLHRWMFVARLHAAWRNFRRPAVAASSSLADPDPKERK